MPRCLRPRAPLGTDPLCAVDSLSLSPSLLLLSVQPQAENFTVLFLQSQPRRFSVRFFTAHNIPLQKIANRLRPNRGPPLCPTIPTPPDLILFALITFKQQHKYGRVHKTPTGWLVALSGPSFGLVVSSGQLLFSYLDILRLHESKRDICATCRDSNLNTVKDCS